MEESVKGYTKRVQKVSFFDSHDIFESYLTIKSYLKMPGDNHNQMTFSSEWYSSII